MTVADELERHVRAFFAGSKIRRRDEERDAPVYARLPHFYVLEVAPPRRGGTWTYVSIGAWAATQPEPRGIEFVHAWRKRDSSAVRVVSMTAHYHANPDPAHRLDHGHTVPLGEPIAEGSQLDHYLISLPYPWPELEVCHAGGIHVDFFWLLPITESEKRFKQEHGRESLEQRFEDAGIDYTDPHRPPVA